MATQINTLVNALITQSTGAGNIATVSGQDLVALGNTVLSSSTATDEFLNALCKRIGKSIIAYRAYSNKFAKLVKDDFQWGAILQRIKVAMPTAEADESYGLTNGASVDHYKVNKPTLDENKLFMKETPYQFHITIQRVHLEEAFTSEAAMGAFISAVYGEVQNAIELALEDLGKLTLGNLMAEMAGTTREIKLITMYNALVDASEQVDIDNCLINEKFLRFAISVIKKTSVRMQSMTKGVFNDGTSTTHTPLAMQNLFVLTDFESALETQVEYAAFNEQYVKLQGFEEIPCWQDIVSPDSIDIKRASDGVVKQLDGIVCVLFDTDACGMYQNKMIASTTGLNSAGLYYNAYYHQRQLWFNNLACNAVMFTLA